MHTKTKLAIIGVAGVPAAYGGFETLVENLLPLEHNTTVYCSRFVYDQRPPHYKGAKLIYWPLKPNGVQSIFYDLLSLMHASTRRTDVVLILGVSATLFLPLFSLLFPKTKFVVNLDGAEWKRDKWNIFAKMYLRLSERVACATSDIVIADNQAIVEYVNQQYGARAILIPYGGDHALIGDIEIAKPQPAKIIYGLAICRIEPENNVRLILEAFSNCDVQLLFIGNWNGSHYGRAVRSEFCSFPNIILLDPIYDIEVLAKYRSGCSFYVHGHSAGGTNPSLVEMMHFGKQIFAFKCSYNEYTLLGNGHYFYDIDSLMELVNDRKKRGDDEEVRIVAERLYTWNRIKTMYKSVL